VCVNGFFPWGNYLLRIPCVRSILQITSAESHANSIMYELAECPQRYCGEFDKCLHFLTIFLTRKLITGIIIRYVSLDIMKKKTLFLNPRTFVFTVLSTVISFKDIRQDCTHSFCMNIINSSWAHSSSSG
jgi:hypothetical protein